MCVITQHLKGEAVDAQRFTNLWVTVLLTAGGLLSYQHCNRWPMLQFSLKAIGRNTQHLQGQAVDARGYTNV